MLVLLPALGGAVAGAQTAPTIVARFAPLASKPVTGSTFPGIKRDCGFTATLSGGDVLWIFCDSTDAEADGDLTYFKNNTAAYGFAGSLTTLREPSNGGQPYRFIDPRAQDNPCTGAHAGEAHVIWPLSATTVHRSDGTDQVLIWFENLCHEGGADLSTYTQMSVGLAEYVHDPADPDPLPELAEGARIVNPRLWGASADGHTFGEAAVLGNDGYHYLYRCRGFWGCQVARVKQGSAAQPGAYRYWTGSGWSTIKPAGPTLALTGGDEPAGSFNVAWLPAMGVYAMGYIEFPGLSVAGVDSVRVRVADDPAGPWSAPVSIRNTSDCGSGCYAGYVHPALSGIDYVGTTSYDQDRYGWPGGGQVRMVQQRVDKEPPPPGVCRSGFADVWSDHRFCNEISWLVGAGITQGFADARFRPTFEVTRQAMAAWFHRQAGAPPGPFPDPGFTDVPADHPFRTAIAWFAQSGLTDGFPDGRFHPERPVSRQVVTAWFHRQAGAPPGPYPLPGFWDVPLDHPFRTPIAWATAEGLVSGYPDDTFRPTTEVTRQTGAAVFARDAT